MKICVSKQSIDDCQPFEIVADIQLIRHAHTAMQLDRVLSNKFSRLADLDLEALTAFCDSSL